MKYYKIKKKSTEWKRSQKGKKGLDLINISEGFKTKWIKWSLEIHQWKKWQSSWKGWELAGRCSEVLRLSLSDWWGLGIRGGLASPSPLALLGPFELLLEKTSAAGLSTSSPVLPSALDFPLFRPGKRTWYSLLDFVFLWW